MNSNLRALLIRNIYFPLMERFKNNKIRKNLELLKKTEKLHHNELIKYQEEKLRHLLKHCLSNVPAYETYKFLLPDVEEDPFGVLQQIPVLTKKHFQKSYKTYFPRGQAQEKLISNRTGGSTGEPVQFYMDRQTVEFYEAARWRGLSWWNIQIGDPSVMIWGSPIELTELQNKKYALKELFLKNRIVIPAYDLKKEKINEYIDFITKFNPQYFYGYASTLFLFSQMLLENKVQLPGEYKGVVSTAETLHDYQRETIEKAFGCKVINEYGARDGGIIAYECPEGKLHVTLENAVVELLDRKTYRPVLENQPGMVTITDLNNYVMPRLRYQLGDLATWGDGGCKCGCGLPCFKELNGREDDYFVSSTGAFVHGHYFNHIARNLDGITQFQIIQLDRNHLIVKIVKSHQFKEEDISYFKEMIIRQMGNVKIKVQYVDQIEPTASGKTRYAVRQFEL